jgi:hypothetical protein
MSSLKKQQKKLLTKEISSRVMEYLIGLNEENQPAMQKVAKRFSGRIVNAYYDAIKLQHKSIIKATVKEAETLTPVEYEETTNLMAS